MPEAAAALGISANTVRAWIKSGKLRSQKVVRPQGYPLRVFLEDTPPPIVEPGEAGTFTGGTTQVPAVDVLRAEAMANYNRQLLEPVMNELHDALRTIIRQAEEIGELRTRLRILEAMAHETAGRGEAVSEPVTRPWWRRVYGG